MGKPLELELVSPKMDLRLFQDQFLVVFFDEQPLGGYIQFLNFWIHGASGILCNAMEIQIESHEQVLRRQLCWDNKLSLF